MFNSIISVAHAQETAAPAAAGPAGGFTQFIPLVLIGLVFYFLIIRPQKKKSQKETQFLTELEKGSEIYTKSGMIGTISGLTEKVVTLEIAEGVKVKMLRSQIAGLSQQLFAAPAEKSN